MAASQMLVLAISVAHLFIPGVVVSITFTITNECDYTVWPRILSNASASALSTTGFSLQNGQTKTITLPASWGGRMWGRTHCTGKFSCFTGDCGSGKVECSGSDATPPATLAEFTLDGYGGLDYYLITFCPSPNTRRRLYWRDPTVNSWQGQRTVPTNEGGASPSTFTVVVIGIAGVTIVSMAVVIWYLTRDRNFGCFCFGGRDYIVNNIRDYTRQM